MLERVLQVGDQARLVEELSGPQVREALAQPVLAEFGDRLEQEKWHILTDYRSALEQALLVRREPVDACRQDRLHRRRHLRALERSDQLISPALPSQAPRLHQGPHA